MARIDTWRHPLGCRIPGGVAAALVAVGAAWAIGAAAGCAAKHPPAVVSNEVLAPGEEDQKVTLSASDRAEALAAMRATTGRPESGDRPARAPRGVRWSDVPLAVAEACDEEGVEMTVVHEAQGPDEYVFELRTVESWPGRLVVRRGDGADVYEITEAWIGRFPDDPHRVQRAEALVKAFKEQLERLGGQAWFND